MTDHDRQKLAAAYLRFSKSEDFDLIMQDLHARWVERTTQSFNPNEAMYFDGARAVYLFIKNRVATADSVLNQPNEVNNDD